MKKNLRFLGAANVFILLALLPLSVFAQQHTLTNFFPRYAYEGEIVTINGTNLSDVTTVLFDGIASPTVTLVSVGQITAEVPTGGSGFNKNIVVNKIGFTAQIGGFNFCTTPAPTVTSEPPANSNIGTGNTFTLSVNSNDATSYQWYFNGGILPAETNTDLSFSPIVTTNSGQYSVILFNTGCQATFGPYQVNAQNVFYSKPTGALNDVGTWGVDFIDGGGSGPVDFTREEHTFRIANREVTSTNTDINITGTFDPNSSKVIITPGTTLTAGAVIQGGATGTLSGSASSNLTITGLPNSNNNQSMLYFADGEEMLKNLTIEGGDIYLNTPLNISGGTSTDPSGVVTVSGGTFYTNDGLVFKSNEYGTARVGVGAANGAYINGNVTVERYITSNLNKRAWRLLSIPTIGDQTIKDSWQEGNYSPLGDIHPGYGTNITSAASYWEDDGFDEKTPSNSFLKYDVPTQALQPFPDPLYSTPISTAAGYFIYIRGDRSKTQSSSSLGNSSTTLRTFGTLYMGNQNDVLMPANTSMLFGNIYASPIDIRQIITTGGTTGADISVWDPKLTGSFGVGGYVTLSYDNITNNYIATPGDGSSSSSYGPTGSIANYIQSGQAFFIRALTTDGTIKLVESSKATSVTSNVFSVPEPASVASAAKRLVTNLYAVTATSRELIDGTLHMFSTKFNNEVDRYDAQKRANFGMNFYLGNGSSNLVVEKRKEPVVSDVISYKMQGMRNLTYELDLTASNLDNEGLAAFLEDSYTKTSTPVGLNGNTRYKFAINSNAASSVINRFRIVFKLATAPTYTTIAGNQQNEAIAVEWRVKNQEEISYYEVEKSINGVDFVKAGTVKAGANSGSDIKYNWLDVNAVEGDNFYRVRSVTVSGNKTLTETVKVKMGSQAIRIYPNPVTDGIIRLSYNGLSTGSYTARLLGNNGSVITSKRLAVRTRTGSQTVEIGNNLPTGTYLLEITHPDLTKTIQKVIVTK